MYKFDEEEIKNNLTTVYKETTKKLHGIDNAMKWMKLLDFIKREVCDVDPNFCYYDSTLEDEPFYIYDCLLNTLVDCGVEFPKKFPKELDFDYEEHDNVGEDKEPEVYASEIIRENKLGNLFYEFFEAYGQVTAFRVAYIDPIIDTIQEINEKVWNKYFDTFSELDFDLVTLTLDKILEDEEDKKFAPKLQQITSENRRVLMDKIYKIKKLAYTYRVPLGSELTYLFNFSPLDLDNEAEKDAFGLNRMDPHPDFYINEILIGLRELTESVDDLEETMEDIQDEKDDDED